MSKLEKLLDTFLRGNSDKNIRFEELQKLLVALGFEERIQGGHHIFTRANLVEIINLPPRRGGKAKPYQVKQVRSIVTQHRLSL